MIKIFIADDHPLIREGFKKILKEEKDFEVSGEASDALQVIDAVRTQRFDVLTLDINMPGKNGLDTLKEIKEINPRLSVLIVSMHPEERFALRTLRAGASGYIKKETAADDLVKAIRKVASGGKYISSSLAEKIAFDLDPGLSKPIHELLSDREFQVFHLIATGKAQSEIAGELSIGISTVNTYRSRILEKLNLRSNAELIHYAITNKLID
jgi:DNA-binding NarL/FixJ family response regulator